MKLGTQWTSRWIRLCALLCLGALGTSVRADPVWHCSRSDIQLADTSEQFTLAALDEREVIRIALHDLYSVYLGHPVKVSGMPLSACLIADENKTDRSPLRSLGVNTSTAKALARKSNITSSHLHIVKDDLAMLACITKNRPAIGYLSKAIHTEAIGPCF
jgi:hypothetical protein